MAAGGRDATTGGEVTETTGDVDANVLTTRDSNVKAETTGDMTDVLRKLMLPVFDGRR